MARYSSRFRFGRSLGRFLLAGLLLAGAGGLMAQAQAPAKEAAPAQAAPQAPTPAPAAGMEGWRFLMGEWVGEGGGQPGQGSGWFSFMPDLQQKVLLRRNHSEFPAQGGRPAAVHDDLMVVWQEGTGAMKAIYFDNEGHVIHYNVELAADARSAVFVSEPGAGPRFRLTYKETGPGQVSLKFEIAPPDKPDAFSTYIESAARRK